MLVPPELQVQLSDDGQEQSIYPLRPESHYLSGIEYEVVMAERMLEEKKLIEERLREVTHAFKAGLENKFRKYETLQHF